MLSISKSKRTIPNPTSRFPLKSFPTRPCWFHSYIKTQLVSRRKPNEKHVWKVKENISFITQTFDENSLTLLPDCSCRHSHDNTNYYYRTKIQMLYSAFAVKAWWGSEIYDFVLIWVSFMQTLMWQSLPLLSTHSDAFKRAKAASERRRAWWNVIKFYTRCWESGRKDEQIKLKTFTPESGAKCFVSDKKFCSKKRSGSLKLHRLLRGKIIFRRKIYGNWENPLRCVTWVNHWGKLRRWEAGRYDFETRNGKNLLSFAPFPPT